MTAEELYEKQFGNVDSLPKKHVLGLLKGFAKALKLEREQSFDKGYTKGWVEGFNSGKVNDD